MCDRPQHIFGAGGITAQEIRSALYNSGRDLEIRGFIAGLGGREIKIEDICAMARETLNQKSVEKLIYWKGIKVAAHNTI